MDKSTTLNTKQLSKFLKNIHNLVDDFHQDIYQNDDIFKGINIIENAILNQINKNKQNR